MAKEKKEEEERPESPYFNPDTMDSIPTQDIDAGRTKATCPYHGQDLEIQTEEREIRFLENGRVKTDTIKVRYAVCTCEVPNNKHRGRRVWEKT